MPISSNIQTTWCWYQRLTEDCQMLKWTKSYHVNPRYVIIWSTAKHSISLLTWAALQMFCALLRVNFHYEFKLLSQGIHTYDSQIRMYDSAEPRNVRIDGTLKNHCWIIKQITFLFKLNNIFHKKMI